jgi:D-glycero-D-manno-heptose 1,7-bisphosphate phosphatase
MNAPRPAVFLDRDGTLNKQIIRNGRPYPPDKPEDFELFPDVAEGCARLSLSGFALVVATNQPDVGRGKQSLEAVEKMHAILLSLVPSLDRIEVCYDSGDNSSSSPRRKPEPGMVLNAAYELNLDLSASWMVGDRWRDIDCGKRAGLKTVFIDFNYDEILNSTPDFRVTSFKKAVDLIVLHSLKNKKL